MNRKLHILKLLSLVFAISLLSFLGSILIYQTKAQWTGAPGLPPQQNVPAPLNIGSSNQQKVGGLTLGKDIYIDPRVSDSTQSGLRLYPNSVTGMYGYLFNNFNTLQYNVQTSTGEERRFTIGNDGNTAIGNIIPQAKLHVDGSIRANGVIQATGKVYSEGNEVLTSFSEQDPKIGTLANNQWCYSDSSQVICNQNAPQTRVASSCSAGSAINIIYSDGTVSCETDDIGTFTLAAGSVASSHILNDTILTQDLNVSDIETTFQRRTSGNCDGQAVVSINQNGTLNCEADDIGLTSVPADSVGSNEIVNSSITSNDIDASSVQRRVSGTCAAGESIREIKSDGTVTCEADDVGSGMSSDPTFHDVIIENDLTLIGQFLQSYYAISNDIIMSAPTTRRVSGSNCMAFPEKSFIVKQGGLFRITFDLWSNHRSDDARFRVLCNNGQVCSPVLVANTGGDGTSGSFAVDMNVTAQPGSKIALQGQTCEWCDIVWGGECSNSAVNDISNVNLRGTLQTPTPVNNGVFSD